MAQSEGAAWRKFLKPVASGLVALMAAASLCLQHTGSTSTDSRLTAVEVEVKNIQSWRGKADDLLYEIRSDVSFIRGKMEGGK